MCAEVLGAGQPEPGLLPGELGHVAAGEELAPVQADTQVEDCGPLQDRVVAVEEGGGLRVVHRAGRGLLLGHRRERAGRAQRLLGRVGGGLAREGGPLGGGTPCLGEPSQRGHGNEHSQPG
jgi:hypothetical protein